MFATRKKTFRPGDRIYANLMLNGQMIAEFAGECLSSLSEVISAMRYRVRGVRGLAKLYIRNLSCGWSEVRHLMLYPPAMPPKGSRADLDKSVALPFDSERIERIAQYMAM